MKNDFVDGCLFPLLIFLGFAFIIVYIPLMANYEENKDYEEHSVNIGKSILLNNDTVQVLQWRTGRHDKNRGYVLSNGMTVDELIVDQNAIN